MKSEILKQIRIMKDYNIKPNFSALSREFNVDRHTIKKYYEYEGVPIRKKRNTVHKWDPYKDEMDEILENKAVSYRALFFYMANKHGENNLPGNYHSLRNYYYALGRRVAIQNKPHLLYETPPGKQSQFDWKEKLITHLKDGTEILFNVFAMTLGHSREHVYIYSRGKSLNDFLHCFIKSIWKIGGVTEEYLTDNMTAIVSIKDGQKRVSPKVTALFKDIGAKLKLCKIKTPETKGKVENSNKFMNWLLPYDYKLESEAELIELIEETITSEANRQINTGTLMPPVTLFAKEKEYLKPLTNKILLESYLDEHISQVVPATLLITYKGNKYSVGSDYISKKVDIYPIEDRLNIYYGSKLIAIHTISQTMVNYSQNHYAEGLSENMKYARPDEIEKMAVSNIEGFNVLERERE